MDFEKRCISIRENYIDSDGLKAPKRESFGEVPMAKELETVLRQLKQVSARIGFDGPTDFVIFNRERDVPVAEVKMRRGFHRTVAMTDRFAHILEDDFVETGKVQEEVF